MFQLVIYKIILMFAAVTLHDVYYCTYYLVLSANAFVVFNPIWSGGGGVIFAPPPLDFSLY